MTVKTCPDCGAPVDHTMWPTMQHGCWFWSQYAEKMRRDGYSEDHIESANRSGADPPCVGNHYDYNESVRWQRTRRGWLWVLAIFAALMMLLIWAKSANAFTCNDVHTFTCTDVRSYVERVGRHRALASARACKITPAQEAQARACLPQPRRRPVRRGW